MKCLNLGVTMLYKLQSNRFYKNTLALRKGAGGGAEETDSLFCPPSPQRLGLLSADLFPSTRAVALEFSSLNWAWGGGHEGPTMPFLFVFPNQSPSRAPVAPLGCYLKRRAISQSLVCQFML